MPSSAAWPRILPSDSSRWAPSIKPRSPFRWPARPAEGERHSAKPREITPPPPVKPAAPAREKRTVGLAFFESNAGMAAVEIRPSPRSGGQLAQTSGSQYIRRVRTRSGGQPGAQRDARRPRSHRSRALQPSAGRCGLKSVSRRGPTARPPVHEPPFLPRKDRSPSARCIRRGR